MNASTTVEHTVHGIQIRANIVQREMDRRYDRSDWLPYIWEGMDTLPQRITGLVAEGHPLSAEYWLISAERFAGVISDAAFQQYVTALGSFQLAG